MANYVVTTNELEKLSFDSLKATDNVYLFYKETDSIKVDVVKNLINLKAQKQFVAYETKEELMVSFGFLAAKVGNLVVLDETIPVPEILKDKIKTSTNVSTGTKRSVKKKTTKASKNEKEPVPKTEKEPEPKTENETLNSNPEPSAQTNDKPSESSKEKVSKATKKTKETSVKKETKNESSEDIKIQELKKLLKITAEDIHYSFGTDFLMRRIIMFVSEARTDEDVRSSLEFNFVADKEHLVAKTVMAHLPEVKRIVNE